MRKLLVILALPLSLVACGDSLARFDLPAPAAVAERTVLDEQVGQGVELAYKAFRVALETATDAGLLRGAAATKAAALDNRAYAATQAMQAAYRAGNATGYLAAAREARAAIAGALTAVKGS